MEAAADLYRRTEKVLYIETVKGRHFNLDTPVFDIEEMAHAMSMQCRYTGHCSKFYSVAEHSVLVSHIMGSLQLGNPFEGLMHDGTEAYLTDIAAPWKALLPDYKRIEHDLDAKLRAHLGLPGTITDGCKRADWLALFVEAYHLLPSRAQGWTAPEGIREQAASLVELGWEPDCLSPREARDSFLDNYQIWQDSRAVR